MFVLDYGGTVICKERFDIYHKHSLSAISGRRPTGNGNSPFKPKILDLLYDTLTLILD